MGYVGGHVAWSISEKVENKGKVQWLIYLWLSTQFPGIADEASLILNTGNTSDYHFVSLFMLVNTVLGKIFSNPMYVDSFYRNY